jgi:hypothetical protein
MALRALDFVDVAEFAPLPVELPAVTPDYTGNQGYLGPATDGVDALYSETLVGGNGSGIKIYDLEYSWNQTHEDLSKANGVTLLLAPGETAVNYDTNHGTAVLGELIADKDTKGVTGISWGADIGLVPTLTNNGLNVANAILLAVDDGSPGDVILIEQQCSVCGLGSYGPVEWNQAEFDAIQTAVANRFVVVEAAGNGDVDLDQAVCLTRFDRTVRDSGAIIVGAGMPPGSGSDRERQQDSSYGSRVDLQGWGWNIMTTGYGDHYTNPDDPTNPDYFYTSTFKRTSGASPIVAGAVANLQGIALNLFGTPLIPFQIRSLLEDTGSPQLGNTAENIGPRPNLQAAIAKITTGPVDLFIIVDLSGSYYDDLPLFKSLAPGIITNILTTINANTKFGLARFEDYPIDPFGSAASGDVAYERLVDLTFNTNLVLNTIAGLGTRYGVDGPQSQLPALYQAASGAGQDLSAQGYPGASIPPGNKANFRNDATKLFLLWTDAEFHLPGDPGSIPYPGPSFVDTVDAILSLDPPKVLGISSGPDGIPDLELIGEETDSLAPPGGVDCDGDGRIDIYKGEPLVCEISKTGEGIDEAIIALVKAAIQELPANNPPVANAGSDRTLYAGTNGLAKVTLDGSGSYDPDEDALTYVWTWTGGSASGVNPSVTLGIGKITITLTVNDGVATDTDTIEINVLKKGISFGDIITYPFSHAYGLGYYGGYYPYGGYYTYGSYYPYPSFYYPYSYMPGYLWNYRPISISLKIGIPLGKNIKRNR